MLTCRDVEMMLQDYLDGYLLQSQREVLEAHLRNCAPCQDLLSGLTQIDDHFEKIGEVGEIEVPVELTRSILESIPIRAYAPSPLRQVLRFAAVPAFACFLVAAGFLLRGQYFLKSVAGEREVEVVFTAPAAASVALVGDFNGWNPRQNLMVRASHEGLWRTRVKLHPGVYQYSFVVNGTVWEKDPQAKKHLADGFGGENSVIIVDG
jgi:anti-sigma factor RsiW